MIVSSWIPPTYSPEASTHSTDCSLPPVSNPTESPTAIEPTTEEPEIPELLKRIGDVNNDGCVTIIDATVTQQITAELLQPTETQMIVADVTGDGKIDITDASVIQRYVAELINRFPAEENETA